MMCLFLLFWLVYNQLVKLIRLIPLVVLLVTGCNQGNSFESASSIDSSGSEPESGESKPYIDPHFEARISDCNMSNSFDLGYELNLNSTYTFNLDVGNKEAYPLISECSFEYDNTCIEIIDCINQRQQDGFVFSRRYVWYLKPLKEVESSRIGIFYRGMYYSSYSFSIKDLSIESSLCASTEYSYDYTSSFFPGKLKLFKDLDSWNEYRNVHKELTPLKNEPNNLTFNDYEYALVTVSKYDFGREVTLNGAFLKNGTLYFDIKSTKAYFEEPGDMIYPTTSSYFVCLLRYSNKLNIQNYEVWNDVTYIQS